MTEIEEEVRKRRTFAIISHPDAGKTTLTEKLLLYGGAIQTAGQVSARRAQRAATSDWMELEKQRGISITSTVLQFPYEGFTVNLLDTPGHQDFGEDTYRTLLAADSAVMLIDAAKGVEPQTKKLFAICRARRIPLFTFINKMDRPSRDPLELLDELENVLGLGAFPMNWPLGNGPSFKGVYDRGSREVYLFERSAHGAKRAKEQVASVDDPLIRSLLDEQSYREFRDGLDLLEGAGAAFDPKAMLHGAVTPVFFGSAVTNFGVQLFLDHFVKMAPAPGPRRSMNCHREVPNDRGAGAAVSEVEGSVDPASNDFSGFVFKIQANMDPRHRDRVAFVRVCSGKFERDMTVRNVRTGKDVRLSRAMRLFASERESLDAAYAGDVVGLANPGVFAIGDTICEGPPVQFEPIPSFTPEHFASVRSLDTGSYKSFGKGIAQLREEGAIQVMYPYGSMRTEPILAAVGALQFEVVKYRLESEYNVKTIFTSLPYSVARHVAGDPELIARAQLPSNAKLVEDWDGRAVALFESEWSLRLAEDWNPNLHFPDTDSHAEPVEA
ncbi:MAG TPA: peptide chain release factor 3 [Candidatus Baltobacteraceae bacterium]|nr:peptide chain release factor 3 [Candidatus Baltobacteraceae bacterium]